LNQLIKHSKATEEGKIVLDLNELGYGKLLGVGQVDAAFTIKINKVSKSAKDKITQAGGEVLISNELTA
jgi:large subunit ribosomal protein L15